MSEFVPVHREFTEEFLLECVNSKQLTYLKILKSCGGRHHYLLNNIRIPNKKIIPLIKKKLITVSSSGISLTNLGLSYVKKKSAFRSDNYSK